MRADFTERERECLRLTLRGLNEREIAKDLGIDLGTVKHHFRAIYLRLGIEKPWNKKLRTIYLLWQEGLIAEIEKGNPCTNS